MVDLNVRTLTEHCYRFLQPMRARNRGWIQNVASVGGFTPSPDYAAYCATKAYVLFLSEGVGFELRGTGVVVSVLCPGFTITEFHQVAGHALPGWVKKSAMTAEKCAEIGLKGLFRAKRVIVPGIANKLAMLSVRMSPRWAVPKSAEIKVGKTDADRQNDRALTASGSKTGPH